MRRQCSLEKLNYGSSERLIRHMRREKERKGKATEEDTSSHLPSDSMQPPAATRTRVKPQ